MNLNKEIESYIKEVYQNDFDSPYVWIDLLEHLLGNEYVGSEYIETEIKRLDIGTPSTMRAYALNELNLK